MNCAPSGCFIGRGRAAKLGPTQRAEPASEEKQQPIRRDGALDEPTKCRAGRPKPGPHAKRGKTDVVKPMLSLREIKE